MHPLLWILLISLCLPNLAAARNRPVRVLDEAAVVRDCVGTVWGARHDCTCIGRRFSSARSKDPAVAQQSSPAYHRFFAELPADACPDRERFARYMSSECNSTEALRRPVTHGAYCQCVSAETVRGYYTSSNLILGKGVSNARRAAFAACSRQIPAEGRR